VTDVEIRPVAPGDAGEVLTIQRAAFASEALIYADPDQPPLTQTLEQLEAELLRAQGFVAVMDGRIVGAIRGRESDGILQIGRIAVAPDMQGEGIGGMLLAAMEEKTSCREAELFTGSLSEANIALYSECGYRETERIDQGDGTAQVFMRKSLRRGRDASTADDPDVRDPDLAAATRAQANADAARTG